jgi:membrane-associated phospholipid phosphatase
MRGILLRHKQIWNRSFAVAVIIGLSFFCISLLINYSAISYATESQSSAVTDILLNRIPVYDVDGIIIYGALMFSFFVVVLLLYEPKTIPFVLKSVALFVVIRSVFISLTHIGAFEPHVVIYSSRWLELLGLGDTADLFFSGHTGFPFLFALVFWKDKMLRIVFLIISVVFAVSVILGHLHYSIDVLGAYFITYTIFEICKKLFANDWHRANRELA